MEQQGLPQENCGVGTLEAYANAGLPSNFEFTEMLNDVIMASYADTMEGSDDLVRNGIVLPNNVVDQKAWRVGKAILTGPGCASVKPGDYFIFPGDKGIKAIQKNGRQVIFLNEERIFGICKPVKE